MNDLLQNEFSIFLEKFNKKLIFNKISSREEEVVFLINKGFTNKKIGETLFISETTVKKHVYNIFNKCSINSRFELICYLRNDSLLLDINTAC